MTETNFGKRARQEDSKGHMVVQENLHTLRDTFDGHVDKTQIGAANVPSTATTVVVPHNLGVSTFQVILSPLKDPGGRYWVTGKTTAQFTINLQVAAPVGGIDFDWLARTT